MDLHPTDPHPRATSAPTGDDARRVDDVPGLTALFDDDVSVVVLRRPLAPELVDDAQVALAQPGFRLLTSVAPGAGPGPLRALLPALPRLAADVHRWTEVLADLVGGELVGVRLVRLDAAMCPRFHVDRVTVRLVTTFAGAGTEYLAAGEVDRRWLGHGAVGADDEGSGLLRPGARVRRASPGDVVLLKGEAWPGHAGRGAVHRSPAARPAAPRLVLTLDLL